MKWSICCLLLFVVSCTPHYSCGVPAGQTCTSLQDVYRSVMIPAEPVAPGLLAPRAVWVAPWVDDAGDLHAASVFYLQPGDTR